VFALGWEYFPAHGEQENKIKKGWDNEDINKEL
jgi:hypothetical protein